MKRFDVAIVGAGPAGLAAALNIARDFSVLLLDRRPFPPHKPCGDLLVEEGMELLAPLSPPESLFLDARPLQIRFVDRDNKLPAVPMQPARRLDRPALSRWLLSLSGENVTLRDRTRCAAISESDAGVLLTLRTEDGSLEKREAGLLVGADGATSIVRRYLSGGVAPHLQTVQELYHTRKLTPQIEFLFDRRFAPGYYLWAIPKSDDTVLIGCPYQHGESSRTFEWARAEYELSNAPLNREVHPITRIDSIEQCVLGRERVILIGEAAGFVRPTSGEGISLALRSGMLLAEAVNENPNGPLQGYRERCGSLLETLSMELQMAEVLRSPEKRRSWISAAARPRA